MPELPEVEFARRMLETWLSGATLERVHVTDARILEPGASGAQIARTLRGAKVDEVLRRGKWLRLSLGSQLLFSHLGMTGKWVLAEAAAPVRFEKVRFEVARGRKKRAVSYVDPRLFGRFLVATENIEAWNELGPDPLHDGIDVDVLHAKLARRKLAIKPVLLDQTVLAGVGNIQATEALFDAKIDPRAIASALSRHEVVALARSIERSIERTLAMQEGDTIRYVEEPNAPNPFVVYGHEGEPCPRCKTPLTKIVLAGRGTVLCPRCQKPKPRASRTKAGRSGTR